MSERPRTILIWGVERVGDAVMTFPALKLLRAHAPDARVTYVTTDYAREIVEISGLVDEIVALKFKGGFRNLPKYMALRKRVRRGCFDKILIFGKSSRYKRRIGRIEEAFRSAPRGHYAERHAKAAMSALGIETDAIPDTSLDLPDRPEIADELMRSGLDVQANPYVVFHPGTNRIFRRHAGVFPGKDKKPLRAWPAEHYAALTQRVFDDFPGIFKVVLVGTKGEKKWVARAFQPHPADHPDLINLCGRTSVRSLLEVLKRAVAVVCCDSGVMHLATVVGARLVALFGPNYENRTGPFAMGDRATTLRAVPVEQALTDFACMEKINVVAVYEALKPLLRRGEPREIQNGGR